MATNWALIRSTLNGMIDACEALEKLPLEDPEYWGARSDFQPDVDVQDFLTRFWRYPEGCQRDIIRIRSHFGHDQKYHNELARALVNTAMACAEIIGLPEDVMKKEMQTLTPHCGSAGKSVESQIKGPVRIAKGWMVPGITKAIEAQQKKQKEKR
jgi:hypothetical protein